MLAVEDMRIVCAKYMARHYLSPNYAPYDVARRQWIEGFAAFLLGNPTFKTSVWAREFCRVHNKGRPYKWDNPAINSCENIVTGVELRVLFEDRELMYLFHNLFSEEE